MRRRAALWLAAPLAAGIIAAVALVVGAAASRSGEDSGIRGLVVPCGIVHERAAPCASAKAGAGARVLVRHRPADPPVATAKADAHGRFRSAVPAGTYVVEARIVGARGAAKSPLRAPAVVPKDGWVTVMVLAGRPAAAA